MKPLVVVKKSLTEAQSNFLEFEVSNNFFIPIRAVPKGIRGFS